MRLPTPLLKMIGDVPEHYLAEAFKILKISETQVFRKFSAGSVGRSVYHDFLLSLGNADRTVVLSLYKRIEAILFIGGCAPGLGIAFNLIDACFCFLLHNWFGLVIAILSCFPIPGFKAAGKGVEKLLTAAIKRIPVNKLVDLFTKQLGKRLNLLRNFVNDKPYITIQKAVREYVTEVNNPFAEEIIQQLNKIIIKFGPRLEEKGISGTVKMNSKKFGTLLLPN